MTNQHNGHIHATHTASPTTIHPTPASPPPVMGLEALTPSDNTPDTSTHGTPRKRGAKGEPWRVAAVIPGFGKHRDVELLLRDMGRLDLRGIDFWVVLVDNATPDRPLSDVPAPRHLRLEHLRLSENTGGAGGFNAGMRRVLAGEGLSAEFDPPDFVWLVDSDARVSRRSLRELVKALVKHKKLCAAGSALVDPQTGVCYELGGNMEPRNGFFVPAARGDVDRRRIISCHYIAACSALVRREAIEKTGLMPEIFIHGDDVEWFLQMRKKTGMKIGAVAASRAGHPLWNRKFQTWVRYYTTRNAYAPIDVMGYGGLTRARRALVDVLRAAGQAAMGMNELAALHIQGLEDAAAGRTVGHAIKGGMGAIIKSTKVRPFGEFAQAWREATSQHPRATTWVHPLMALRCDDLPGLRPQLAELGLLPPSGWRGDKKWLWWHHRSLGSHLKSDLVKAVLRGLFTRPADVALVPTGQPSGWFRGTTLFLVTADGFQVRNVEIATAKKDALHILLKGTALVWKLYRRPRTTHQLPPAPVRRSIARGVRHEFKDHFVDVREHCAVSVGHA